MDLGKAPTFDPTIKHTTSLSELRSLDMYPGMGIAGDEFWALFSKCTACHNFMTIRTIPYHICPRIPTGQFPSLLKCLNELQKTHPVSQVVLQRKDQCFKFL